MQKMIIYINTQTEINIDIAAIKDKEIIVVIPAEDVLLTHADLPKLSKARLMQALPFALEEQLIADVDTLHFATVQQDAASYAVAIIAKTKMQTYVEMCKQAKIKPDLIIPEYLAIPGDDLHWHIFVINAKAIVRYGVYQGFACELNNLTDMLQLILAATELPQEITIHNFETQSIADKVKISVPTTEKMLVADEFISYLEQFGSTSDLNLLQGHFSNTKTRRAPAKKLQYSLYALAASMLLLLFVYPSVSYFLLNQRLKTVNNEIAAIYQRNFPNAKGIIAPKMRLEQKLHAMVGSNTQSSFLTTLANVANILTQSTNITLSKFDYQSGQLNLDLVASSSDDIANFSNALSAKGFKVKQQNIDITDTRVNAILVVT